jgi:DNA-binding MarR family transcriptional regulator
MIEQEQDDPHEITPELREVAIGLANAISVMLSIRSTMPLQHAITFLQVAQEEGLTVTALASRLATPTSTISRHLLDLGRTNRHNRPGFGLVRRATLAHHDQRENRVYLTERGAAVVRLMIAAFGRRSFLLKMPRAPLRSDGRSRRRTKGERGA